MFTFKRSLIAAAVILLPLVTPAANIPVVTGLNPITIPTLISLNYSAYNVFSTAEDGEIIFVWNPVIGSWDYYICDFGIWDPIAPVFTPGQGIFYLAVAPQTFTPTFHARFVGDGGQATDSPLYGALNQALVENRYYFQGSPTGQSASYDDIFGGPPLGETTLFRFIPGSFDIDPRTSSYRQYFIVPAFGLQKPR